MFVSLLRYVKGYLKIRIEGYSPERFMNACRHRNIGLWGLTYRNGAYEMYVTIRGFKKLKPVIRKTGTKVVIIERFGLPFFCQKYKKRKMFVIGAFGCIGIICGLSLFIWDIEVTGNKSYSDETLIDFLEEKDIYHGMWIKDLDCSKIVKEIRKNYNDIVWVSASIHGTRLLLQIKENEMIEQVDSDNEKEEHGSDIVSTEKCIIKEIITRKGNPLVTEGMEVNEGDVLVTGIVEVFNDNKEVIGYQIENAQADIRGELQYSYEDKEDNSYEEKEYLEQKKEELYIRIHDMLFWFGGKKHGFERAERILSEKQICLGEHFKLPIWYGSRITKPYTEEKKSYTTEELQQILSKDFEKYCEELSKKGVEIIENSVKIYTKRNFALAKGMITVICDIGEENEVQIPELPMEEELNGND